MFRRVNSPICFVAQPGAVKRGGGKMAYDEKTAERVREALSDRRDVVEKKLMGGLCFMVNDSMCCSVSGRGGLLVRVGAEAREQMLAEPHVQPAEMRGRTMSGFVRVAVEGYRTDAALRIWVERGIAAARLAKASTPKPRGARKRSKVG
jgi:TfoX/Sxy family transcriptional regulator of competence genes